MPLLICLAVVCVLLLIAAVDVARTPFAAPSRPSDHGREQELGLPPGRIVYTDADGTAQPLAAHKYPLCGKPDYVVRTPEGLHVPVEVKSARIGKVPRHEDVLQVATYLLILDDLYPHDPTPRYGLLHYRNADIQIVATPDLRAEVLDILTQLQAIDNALTDAALDDETTVGPPGNPGVARCRACAFKAICEDAAVGHRGVSHTPRP